MELELMQVLWYIVLAVSVVFYVVLDGFDLGVGILQIFGGPDRDRRIFLNSIGPFWDGNEVWLIIVGGGLFVGFPEVYAVVFSGFYLLFMLLLMGIIFRACAIEFRSKMPSPVWRTTWDYVFWLSSLMITFGAGLLLGNLLQGFPLGEERELYFSFWNLFTPYTTIVGIFSIFLFAMHGNHFLLMKTEGELQAKLARWIPWTTALFCLFFAIITMLTWTSFPYMLNRFFEYPGLWALSLILAGAIGGMIYVTYRKFYGYAFFFSILTISLLFALFAIGTFPNLIISTINKDLYSLTVFNASASATTLTVALVIAVIGVPLVLAYGWILYHVFRGKTQLHDHSY